MIWNVNDDQRLLQQSAEDFLRSCEPVQIFRAQSQQPDWQGYDPDTWRSICELGWPATAVPEKQGGYEFGYVGLGTLMREAGRYLLPSPLLGSSGLALPVWLQVIGDSDPREFPEAQRCLLNQVTAGEKTLALAIDESHRHQPDNIALTAIKDGDGYFLQGNKRFVVDGACADTLLVVARTGEHSTDCSHVGLFVVEADNPGLTRESLNMLDHRNMAHLEFDNVRVEQTALLGTVDEASEGLQRGLDVARCLLAAEMLGGVEACFEATLEYLKVRDQFDAIIGSFQALQHRMARLYIDLEQCRAVVLAALKAADTESPANGSPSSYEDSALPKLASLAKAKLNDLSIAMTNEAVQLHGGIGVTEELDIGLYLKRSRLTVQLLGDSRFHRDRFALLEGY